MWIKQNTFLLNVSSGARFSVDEFDWHGPPSRDGPLKDRPRYEAIVNYKFPATVAVSELSNETFSQIVFYGTFEECHKTLEYIADLISREEEVFSFSSEGTPKPDAEIHAGPSAAISVSRSEEPPF